MANPIHPLPELLQHVPQPSITCLTPAARSFHVRELMSYMDTTLPGQLRHVEPDSPEQQQQQQQLQHQHQHRHQNQLYTSDPVLVTSAAPSAAVKYRSHYIPPIGVFWDIENCQVPRGRSAMAVTKLIRDKFYNGYKEAEFVVVCDIQKENEQIIKELNDAQVDLIHVSSTCKNAADEKLRQFMRRFADTHGSPGAIILISGDVNFASDLSDLKHRKKIHVILLHNTNTSEALIMCADEHYEFSNLLKKLPPRSPTKQLGNQETFDILVNNLPEDKETSKIKHRLKQLSYNCGGRVIQIRSNMAVVRFTSQELAERAEKRMQGELVFNQKINVKCLKVKDIFNKTQDKSLVHDNAISSEPEAVNESTNEMYHNSGAHNSGANGRSLPGTPHHYPSTPIVGNYGHWNGVMSTPQGGFPPPMHRIRTTDASCRLQEQIARNSPQVWAAPTTPHPWPHRGWDERRTSREYPSDTSHTFRASSTGRHKGSVPFPRFDHHHTIPDSIMSRNWPNGGNHNGPTYNEYRGTSPTYYNNQDNWRNQKHRTPSPTPRPYSRTRRSITPLQENNSDNDEMESIFNPRNGPIELQVTNLDQNIDAKDMRRILSGVFSTYVMVLGVTTFSQTDGNYAATVKVSSIAEAQYAISKLHRHKIGFKRILISYAHSGGPNPQIVRSQVVMLLQEVAGHTLPLFKFRDMYENRYLSTISISELYKLRDVCLISDDTTGRMVSLNPDHRDTPPICLNTTLDGQALELPYCLIHAQKPLGDKGWAEQEMATLPNIKISLKLLNERVNRLLTTHQGSLPLPSFPSCYEAEFDKPLQVDENGVPLEHLISCLNTIELKQGQLGSVKHIIWSGSSHNENYEENKCPPISPPLANQLALFSRELVDLLKTAPHCQLSFNRFIPAYHHHFGRQCRVADYGFTKLIDLLEALSHTVQVMGEGNNRIVTLSHRAQVRRFTSDLLRVLKAQASKQVTLSEFPVVYSRVIGKPWDVADYGVCELDDILGEVSENTVVVNSWNNGQDRLIAIPKREQTAEEIEKTRQFAAEVIELLKHAPQQRMLFNKFVPSYHHHFGHQCRVSDYGFTKLIELFEAIPDIVKIEEVSGGERRISLTEKEGLRVLGEQISKLIACCGNPTNGQLMISNVSQAFLKEFGYYLKPELFSCSSISQLMEKLEGSIKIVNTRNGAAIVSIDKSHIQHLGLECRRVLMDVPNNCLAIGKFEQCYEQIYHKKCCIEKYAHSLEHFVRVCNMNNECFIELTPLQRFACNVQRVLMHHNGKVNISQFEAAYLKVTGAACRPAQYGFSSLFPLLCAIPCTVVVKEVRHRRKIVQLNKKLAAVGLLPPSYPSSPYQDTDSSTDSIENEYFSAMVSNQSSLSMPECSTKWDNSQQYSWNNEQAMKSDHWALTMNEDSQQWLTMDGKNEAVFESLKNFSSSFPPPPSKLHTSGETLNKVNNRWPPTSIWSTPPKYFSTNVEVPPLTLSPLKQITTSEAADNLISPTRNLLPAAANPLNPRLSPYFTNKHNVVAPHPSELPLPCVFTPPKEVPARVSVEKESIDRINETPNNTPSKRAFVGKCRLAAQFNQPPADT
ncbi:hypothetical protein TKK_0007222 [Trichogramma kaykai]|uniref:Meiosis regulator and mRNA stability factor 1 n=1 Tax=Trichogramma kaykai TaxID=54128 RepID=A0ABD2X8U7_9HYME